MNRLISLILSAMLPLTVSAESHQAGPEPGLIAPADRHDLADFKWLFRPIVIFADTPADPRYSQQMEWLNAELDLLAERDVLILTDTDPGLKSSARTQLRPRGFQFVLLGKDGRVLMRRPSPRSVREITRSIDKLPTRQQEIRDRRNSN